MFLSFSCHADFVLPSLIRGLGAAALVIRVVQGPSCPNTSYKCIVHVGGKGRGIAILLSHRPLHGKRRRKQLLRISTIRTGGSQPHTQDQTPQGHYRGSCMDPPGHTGRAWDASLDLRKHPGILRAQGSYEPPGSLKPWEPQKPVLRLSRAFWVAVKVTRIWMYSKSYCTRVMVT